MVAVAPLAFAPPPAEQRMLIRCTWNEYAVMRELLDGPSLRMTYLKGRLELMSPSNAHELWKTNIARLVELFAHLRRIDLRGYGSTTFKSDVKERGAEPDECYLIGKRLADYPEIVLEVIHTRPLVDKLEVYRGFGVAEVWVYEDQTFTIHHLSGDGASYTAKPRSALIPDLDFDPLLRFVARDDTPAALREFEDLVLAPRG